MSKNANSGELNTAVYFKRIVRITDDEGFNSETEENIYGVDEAEKDIPVFVKWVNAHGTEVFTVMQLKLRDPATITMRFSPLIDETLIIYRSKDARPYEVVSIDDVENQHEWLEIKVQRKVEAR